MSRSKKRYNNMTSDALLFSPEEKRKSALFATMKFRKNLISTGSHVTVKEEFQKNGLMSEKSNVIY